MGGQNQKKILLIEPPFHRLFKSTYSLDRYPLGLGYLSTSIRDKTNWKVLVYNADFTPDSELKKLSYLTGAGSYRYLNALASLSDPVWEEVKAVISEYCPDVVGISSKSQNFSSACIVAKLAKIVDKNVIIAVGGPHCSMMGASVLANPDIDICVKGEGEETIVDLLQTIEQGKDLNAVNGIAYKEAGKIFENSPRTLIHDLDSLRFPHEDAEEILRDYDKYHIEAFQYIFATRGCPYSCSFCGSKYVWGQKVRFRSPANVVAEMEGLRKKGLKRIHFDDDTFGVNNAYINDLCENIIKHCHGTKWSCEIHVKLVNERNIALMKKAGCYLIKLGVESGNNVMLRKVRKNITIEEAFVAAKLIKKYGIWLEIFFIIGFPDDTEETVYDTFTAMKKIACDEISYSIFTPYPGTELFDYCKESGLIPDHYDVCRYNHQSHENCFCRNISHQRFIEIASEMEHFVEKRNRLSKLRDAFSLNVFKKFKEYGIRRGIRKGLKLLINR